MSRALLVLTNAFTRARAAQWLAKAPDGTRIEFKGPKRTLPQNDRMWAMLTDIALQREHHGQRLSTEDWKRLFLAQLRGELRLVPNLDGDGFVPLGQSSSDLSVGEMSGLIELMFAYGAKHGIAWSDPAERAREAA